MRFAILKAAQHERQGKEDHLEFSHSPYCSKLVWVVAGPQLPHIHLQQASTSFHLDASARRRHIFLHECNTSKRTCMVYGVQRAALKGALEARYVSTSSVI